MAMLGDVRDNQPRYANADYLRDVKTVSRRLASEGVRFATERLPIFFDGLLGYLETGKSVYPGFKTPGTRPYPAFLQGLVAPIYEDATSSRAVKNIELLYQFCVSFKKLKGPYKEKVLADQLSSFVQTDISLSDVDLSCEPAREIARDARALIGRVIRGLDPHSFHQAEEFVPRPGPGATNSPTKHADRFRMSVWYPVIGDNFNPDEWFRSPAIMPRHYPLNLRYTTDGQLIAPPMKRLFRNIKPIFYEMADHGPHSRFKAVPKTVTKPRGICIEENEVQWIQQALRRALYQRIESHPLTRGVVNFTDQLINRNLALVGSMFKEWATIDMSAASDRISRALVSYLFADNQPLLEALLAVSTEVVELPQVKGFPFITEMPVKKMSPMGSAICFPVMGLVHWALIQAILNRSSLSNSLKRKVYVYGDDVIVKSQCAQAVYDYLPIFGMRINVEKSFSQSYFRESCGLHAYKGANVTPVRFKTVLSSSSSPQELATALRLEEALHYKGFSQAARVTRKLVREVATKFGIRHVPYVDTESPLFGFYRTGGEANLARFKSEHKYRWVPNWIEASMFGKVFAMLNFNGDSGLALSLMIKWILRRSNKGLSASNLYSKVAVIVDKFDEQSSFRCEEERYLRYLVTQGKWASEKYDEGPSRRTFFKKVSMQESALGYRC